MTLLVTEAVVLHVMNYLESSRIVRLATREGGLQSAVAKGARRPKSRYGAALDLFTEGSAQLLVKAGRDLHTLAGFEATRVRPGLAADLGRFTGASAIAELMLRFAHDEAQPDLFEALVRALDELSVAPDGTAREVTLAAAWRLVGTLGFAPSLDRCSSCHGAVARDDAVRFHHRAGGVVCARCARAHPGGRPIPIAALDTLRRWLDGEPAVTLPAGDGRAHQRLLREFLREHLADGRPLRAFESWEQDRLATTPMPEAAVARPATVA